MLKTLLCTHYQLLLLPREMVLLLVLLSMIITLQTIKACQVLVVLQVNPSVLAIEETIIAL